MTWGNIAIAVRVGGPVWPEFLTSWSWLLKTGIRPNDALIAPALRMPAHEAANWIIDRFLQEEELASCDTLCMVDDDHTFLPDTLEKLRSNPNNNQSLDMVGALYTMRRGIAPILLTSVIDPNPLDPYVVAQYQSHLIWPHNETMFVDACGFGFTMVRRGILEKIAAHPQWGKQIVEYGPHRGTSEDIVFCRKVRALGGCIGVDTSVIIGHLTSQALTIDYGALDEEIKQAKRIHNTKRARGQAK